jgi:hypothetical protein
VAKKATSDLWVGEFEDEMMMRKGINAIYGYNESKWKGSSWFENIHPEEYKNVRQTLFILRTKTEKWQDEYRLDVLTILINTFLTEALS